jgi:hypothetical protein
MALTPVFELIGDAVTKQPRLLSTDDESTSNTLYLDILLRQVVDLLSFTSIKSWDAQVVRFDLHQARETRYGAREPKREGTKVAREELVRLFPESLVLKSEFLNVLNLPPDTSIRRIPGNAETRSLQFENPFVTVVITLKWHSSGRGIGRLRELCGLKWTPFSGPGA